MALNPVKTWSVKVRNVWDGGAAAKGEAMGHVVPFVFSSVPGVAWTRVSTKGLLGY